MAATSHTSGTVNSDRNAVNPGHFVAGKGLRTLYAVAIFLGTILFALGLYKDHDRTWHGFLTSFMYWTDLALGGLFFVAIQHVSKAGWSRCEQLLKSLGASEVKRLAHY